MTQHAAKRLGRWLSMALIALASVSCAGITPTAATPHRAPPAATYAGEIRASLRSRGDFVAQQAETRARQLAATRASSTKELKHFRRLGQGELNQQLIDKAVEILGDTYGQPLGTMVTFELDGETYLALTELHYREPGCSTTKPTGYHRGVSMFVKAPVS